MGWIWGIGIGVAVLLAVALTAIPLAKRWRKREAQRAVRQFRQTRERLEAKFIDLAQALGKPRGLRWMDCDWLSAVTFARDRQTGHHRRH